MFTEEREQGVRKDWSTLLNTAEKRTGFYNCWGLEVGAEVVISDLGKAISIVRYR